MLADDGAQLIVAGYENDLVVSFAVDGERFTELSRVAAPTPVCLVLT